jgi:hypothetical protein
MLTLIVALAAFYFAWLGLLGLTSPTQLLEFFSHWQSRSGLWLAAIVRLLFGLALWAVAPQSQATLVLQLLAVLSVFGAVLLPLLGVERFSALLSWGSALPPAVIRAWSIVPVVLGMFILWAVIA